jgi:23S rRNA A1618 N6-methylase RlmF
VAAGAMVLLYAGTSYHLLNIATAVIGFGNSCIFPLLICLANDYHFTM